MSTSNSTQTFFPSSSSHNNVLPSSPGKNKTSYYSAGSYPPYLKTYMPKSLGSQLRMKYGQRLKHHMLRTPGLVFYIFGWSCKISKKALNLSVSIFKKPNIWLINLPLPHDIFRMKLTFSVSLADFFAARALTANMNFAWVKTPINRPSFTAPSSNGTIA